MRSSPRSRPRSGCGASTATRRRGPGWRYLGRRRLPQGPVRRRRGRARRAARHPVQRRPPRRGGRQRHLLPGVDGPRRHLGPRPRGADRRRDRPRAAGRRRQPHRRGVRQRAAPPGVGSGPGDLRRGPAPRRRARRRPDPRPATSRDGVREALRLQLDGERPLLRRHRGRRGRPPRGVPPALPPHRRRGRRLGDVGVQQRQRRVVRARTASCSPTSCATSGASRASSSATGSSGSATPPPR